MILKQADRGFTLIEMAVVLLIGAAIMGAGLKVLTTQLENSNYTETKSKQESIKDALITYLGANSRLPCPDTDFTAPDGIENRATAGDPTTVCYANYGIVPYQTLQISQETALDGWDNYLSYQISTTPANGDWSLTSNFRVGNVGTIRISTRQSSASAAVLEPNLAAVVLVSHGKNGAGAYTVKGTQYAPPSGSDELANAASVTPANTFYRRGYSDDSSGGGVFDDLILSVLPNDLITPLAKQGVFKLPKAQLAEQFNDIYNAIIGYIVSSGSCSMPPDINGLGVTNLIDPWGTSITYISAVPTIGNAVPASDIAFTLTSSGSGTSLPFSKTVGAVRGVISQSINSYTTVCP